MGAKAWMLVYADHEAAAALKARPVLDRTASALLAQRLFPGETLTPLADGSLDCTTRATTSG